MELQELVKRINGSKEWNPEDLKELCYMAGMSEEWEKSDGENFEEVAYMAAEKLGIEILGGEKMYQEVITIKGWVDGSGWSYEQEYSNQQVTEIPEKLEVSDVWEAEEKQEGKDTQIIVSYYDGDDDDLENPLKVFKFWESELFE